MDKRTQFPASKLQAKILTDLATGWAIRSTPRLLCRFERLRPYRQETLKENSFRALRDAGWIEEDPTGVQQWRISEKGRKAIGLKEVRLCH
jgi:hypothetical protein